MINSTFSEADRIVCAEAASADFDRVVQDLYLTLSQLDGHDMSWRRDGAGSASFDVAGVRIVVAEQEHSGAETCLSVAVAVAPDGTDPDIHTICEDTCSSMIDHLQRRHPTMTIIRGQGAAPVRPKPDLPVAGLRAERGEADQSVHRSSARPTGTRTRARAATARARGGAYFSTQGRAASLFPRIVDDMPDPLPDPNCARLRSAFTWTDPEPEKTRLSTPLRLSAHLLNASLIMVWGPLAAGVMAYSMIMGEDARFSGRLVVLTGLFNAAFDTRVGQSLTTMLGV